MGGVLAWIWLVLLSENLERKSRAKNAGIAVGIDGYLLMLLCYVLSDYAAGLALFAHQIFFAGVLPIAVLGNAISVEAILGVLILVPLSLGRREFFVPSIAFYAAAAIFYAAFLCSGGTRNALMGMYAVGAIVRSILILVYLSHSNRVKNTFFPGSVRVRIPTLSVVTFWVMFVLRFGAILFFSKTIMQK